MGILVKHTYTHLHTECGGGELLPRKRGGTDIRKRKFSLNFVILTILLPKRNILIVIKAQVVEVDTISDILTRKQQRDEERISI